MKLVIVESPTKARKLTGYLGQGFQVEASVGHVRDLPKSGLGIDVDNNFEPTYEVSQDKQQVVSKLKKLAQQAEHVILATDPDREGEAIAWHVRSLLQETKSKAKKSASTAKFSRATFHEITKAAVLTAIENPGKLNDDLVDAQQARRVVDRLVGYKISPVLWRKIRRGLSAGRVQSVALRLIVDREREIEAFIPEEYWELDVALATESTKLAKGSLFVDGKVEELPPDTFVARVIEVSGKKYEPTTAAQVTPVMASLEAARYAIKSVERKDRRRKSLPPFSTSTLQQAAANSMGLTSKATMRLAQQLYEEGLITYHRTDSFALSQPAIEMARGYITSQFGKEYLPDQPQIYSSKSKNAQEAHEAIRVTDVAVSGEAVAAQGKLTDRHAKLYDLIWRRFLASQMVSAVYDQTTIEVSFTAPAKPEHPTEGVLRASGSIMKFNGWMRLFPGGDDQNLPQVTAQQTVFARDLSSLQKFTQPPARYNDASLVKELEKRGIGRPSTYASIISVIEDRGYVERDSRRFLATPIGMTVCDFLVKNFPTIMDYDFTAQMEDDLDGVARGEHEWRSLVKNFYTPFEKTVDKVLDKADRVQVPVEKTGEACPTCGTTEGGEIVIRSGRFGKFKSCSRFPECDFTQNIVEKLENVSCPLCQKGEVVIKKSRWGKPFFGCGRYPECGWASWKKPEPGFTITQAEWEVQQAERKARAEERAARMGKTAKTTTTKVKSKSKAKPKSKASTKKKSVRKKSTKTATA